MKPGYEQIRNDREINLLIEQGNRNLKVLGYTEHSRKHAVKVAETAGRILKELVSETTGGDGKNCRLYA